MKPCDARSWLLHLLWPQSCAHCGRDLPREAEAPLCGPCLASMRPNDPPFCLRCAEPVLPRREFCARCPAPEKGACRLIRAAYLYWSATASLVHAFKYRGRRAAAVWAGRMMARSFGRFPELARAQALVPVPLHSSRLAERGYNQAEVLALELSRQTGIPVLPILSRTRRTRPQWKLGRTQRLQNLEGAFWAGPQARGKKIIIVDDVCTSGASLDGCAAALRQAGALDVRGYVLARET